MWKFRASCNNLQYDFLVAKLVWVIHPLSCLCISFLSQFLVIKQFRIFQDVCTYSLNVLGRIYMIIEMNAAPSTEEYWHRLQGHHMHCCPDTCLLKYQEHLDASSVSNYISTFFLFLLIAYWNTSVFRATDLTKFNSLEKKLDLLNFLFITFVRSDRFHSPLIFFSFLFHFALLFWLGFLLQCWIEVVMAYLFDLFWISQRMPSITHDLCLALYYQ